MEDINKIQSEDMELVEVVVHQIETREVVSSVSNSLGEKPQVTQDAPLKGIWNSL